MRLADAIALPEWESPRTVALATSLETRLGEGHSLPSAVRRGVGYHHGSLPRDVLTALEDAYRERVIRVLVSTTTLTDGVNLPARTVVVAAQGHYGGGGGYQEFITGPRLLNAIGRAGRAAIETEGWVVLARTADFDRTDFDRLEPSSADLTVVSGLASEQGLAELATLEERMREDNDAFFGASNSVAAGFVSWLWQYLARDEEADIEDAVASTLAWVQLAPSDRLRWLEFGRAVRRAFMATPRAQRSRWANAGLSIGSARRLGEVFDELQEWLVGVAADVELDEVVRSLLTADRLDRLFALPEAPEPRLRRHRTAARDIPLDLERLVLDWMSGQDIVALSNVHATAVTDAVFRLEQTSDFVTEAFENYLPWALAILIGWASEQRDEPVPAALGFLPAAIRFGVDSPAAATLLSRGISSRPFAVRVAQAFSAAESEDSVRDWLARLDPSAWATVLQPSPLDVRDLLDFLRRPGARFISDLLEGEVVALEVVPFNQPPQGEYSPVELVLDHNTPVPRIAVVAGQVLGHLPVELHADFEAFLATGLPIASSALVVDDATTVSIRRLNFALDAPAIDEPPDEGGG
jgi:hypothetical protein